MPDIAAGAQVEIRNEEWIVRSVRGTQRDGLRLEVTGVTELVRDQEAVFFTVLDAVTVLDPTQTRLVADDTPQFRRSRLWLESLLRQGATPSSERRIVSGHRALLDPMGYQLRPAEVALNNLRPRILIGDAVGLGKTLEIGILLTELIERGRGERILVVTPRAVLEQFQHELWTRFAIPLVRLDTEGIQKVRQTLPASRNPFSYYRRVIASIDTLKNPARYRHHLKNQRWAFLNEAINQLAVTYLDRRQAELGETIPPDRYAAELQKVKAYLALHRCYGVDLNATAVELAEVSLWLNVMHPGLAAPWFGLHLRRGNSLVGARRATYDLTALGRAK